MDEDIASIEEHELRSVWAHEERDFTRWLTDNIDLLAAALGIEIEDARAEEAVGDFASDIVAQEMNTGEPIVIENQYGQTDHDHLGKLLTYSAGKHAGFSLWLAESFRPEHKSVLEWLNESGPTDAKFFAIRPRVITIPDCTERGFEFEIVVEPNEYERELGGEESLTDTEREYRTFFEAMVEAYAERRPRWRERTPGTRGYLTFGAGKTGMSFGWVFHQGPEFSVELYISTATKATNEALFDKLREARDEIEDSIGAGLTWERLPEKQACRIKWPRSIPGRITELSDEERAEIIEWGVEAMDAFQTVLEPRIDSLDVDSV